MPSMFKVYHILANPPELINMVMLNNQTKVDIHISLNISHLILDNKFKSNETNQISFYFQIICGHYLSITISLTDLTGIYCTISKDKEKARSQHPVPPFKYRTVITVILKSLEW